MDGNQVEDIVASGTAYRGGSIAKLAAALIRAQLNYKPVKKTRRNPFFNSKYADLRDYIAATRDALAAEGLTVVQFPVHQGERQAGVETILVHDSGEYLASEPFLVPVEKGTAQALTAAVTYCRRSAYCAVVGVAAEDDDGNATVEAKEPPKRKATPPVDHTPAQAGSEPRPGEKESGNRTNDPKPTKEERKAIGQKIRSYNQDAEAFGRYVCKAAGVTDSSEISTKQWQEIFAKLDELKAAGTLEQTIRQ